MTNKTKLDGCVEDMKKILEAQKVLSNLSTHYKESDNVDEYLRYVLRNRVLSSLEDTFYVSQKLPEMAVHLAQAIEKYGVGDLRSSRNSSPSSDGSSSSCSRYAGTYERLSDVPGYGTEWNERCIPDGVCVTRNGRC